MEHDLLIQTLESHKGALARIVSVSASPDGSMITLGTGRIRRTVSFILSSMAIIVSFLLFVFSCLSDWRFAPIWPLLILWCIYVTRQETRTITVNLRAKTVDVDGKWLKKRVHPWTAYRGNETQFTVKQIPETLYIMFLDGDRVCRVKLAELSPLLRRYNPANYHAISSVWLGIENEMSRESSSED